MENIREALTSAIKTEYGIDFEPDLTPAPANIEADYSTNAPLKLAKTLHLSPQIIAESLASHLAGTTVTAPGFLNFTVKDADLAERVSALANDFDRTIISRAYEGQTVICEFSDPNPFKVLHVGHLYTSIMGDAISRLYEYAGAKVIRANFGGDVGLHVAKTMYILQQKPADSLTIDDIGCCYVEGTAAYEDDVGAKQEITALNKEIYRINAENIHGTPLADLYWRGRELSYEYFDDFYASIGVKFDKYYPESTVAALGLKTVKEHLRDGVYELSNGAVIFPGDRYGLHTRVFINREGVPTYEAKDVGLIFTKWQDYHFDRSVIITGSEQKDYMAVVLKSIEQYAPNLVRRTSHLTHGIVKLPGAVKMSSRKGNFLKAVDVIGLVKDALASEYNSTDPTVALAATKYAFLKYKMGGEIIFDPSESVKMTGNSGPYLLYAAVRARKIVASASSANSVSQSKDAARTVTYNPYEKALALKLLAYQPTLTEAVTEMAPHKVATYLYELAQEFSRFYEHCQVVGSPEEAARLTLTRAYLSVITHGLQILGINIPEEM